jgi:hypothetical protein
MACLSAAACQDLTAYPPPRLAAVLSSPRSWVDAATPASIWLTYHNETCGSLLSDARVELGVVRWWGGEERVACTEFEGLFVVHVDLRRGPRPAGEGGFIPEMHCRVLDSEDRPLGFICIDPASFTTVNGRSITPLAFVFAREGRDLAKARVIVTTEEREHEFRYESAAAAPSAETEADGPPESEGE